ncbi:calcium-activated chloride channel regulator 1-like [Megalops cyprinoides]|uniref:calcium-activated chloride channel regulator 1-like n=1 Tax=Megalops cyprinoides TaxID=118141 RepID=UPI0018653499|nr:calcium-activated chloride channel regulator 1-like [Megalops cyprinoides]
MRTPKPIGSALVVYLLASVSGIRLDGNGYTDVVFAINPAVLENSQLIERIKDMVIQSSHYLFEVSINRFYFKEVKILVPPNWSKGQYSKARTETYEKANIIINKPNPQHADDPYTLQYGECGAPGRYIHLTPNFLLIDNLLQAYGPRERVLVHEWAHLRWGVYDEYNEEQPFYSSGNIAEATRCPKAIVGRRFAVSKLHNSMKSCSFDQNTGLPTGDCAFYPEKHQNIPSSIMYLQSLDLVSRFCNKTSHNAEAPNKQNRICNYRSVQEVIDLSEDFRSSVPMEKFTPPEPKFTVLKRSRRVVCLVLDVSGSMFGGRIQRQRQAASLFLRRIEEKSSVGIVTFTHNADILKNLTLIDSKVTREALVSSLPNNVRGSTDICAGLEKGFEVLREDDGDTTGDEIIFLTDGESEITCIDRVAQSGAIVQTIALGPSPNAILQNISEISGGKYFVAREKLETNELVDVFSSLTTSDGDLARQTIQLESTGKRADGNGSFNGIVSVDKTVGNQTTFLIIYETIPPSITIISPTGTPCQISNFKHDATKKMLSLEIPGTAERGDWEYRLHNTMTSPQSLTMTVTSRAARADVAPVTVEAHMSQQSSDGSKPMAVFADVNQKGVPVTLADVWATIVSSSGDKGEIQLLDNGAGADIQKHDGIYSRYFTNLKDGKHNLKVRVRGQGDKARANKGQSHAMYLPGYVIDGEVKLNPPKPTFSGNDLQVDVGNFSRTAIGESFIVSLPPGVPPPEFPPCKIIDLTAKIEEDQVFLNWTAPGEDLDQGTATAYEIRMSEDFELLRTNFSDAQLINTSGLPPQEAGSMEGFSFILDSITMKNGTVLFFAIKAEDKYYLKSDVSNIAQASWIVESEIVETDVDSEGEVKLNPPKPTFSGNDLQMDVGNFSRTAIGESFIVSLPPGVPPPEFPPSKIIDLTAKIEEDQVFLNWTAPREDLDQRTGTPQPMRFV